MVRLSILHTVEFYAPHVGGSEAVVQRVSEGLVRRGHQVTVATSAMPGRTWRERNGVTVEGFAVEGNAARGIAGEVDRYRRFLLEHGCDVAMNYAAQQWATDVALGTLGTVWSRRANVLAPCGYSALRDDLSPRWPGFSDYFARTLPTALPLYDAVVYHSPTLRDRAFGDRLGLGNGEIIRNGTDESEFRVAPAPAFRARHGITTPYMGLCVANYLPDKGYERIVDAVRAMGRTDFTMVCIGGSSELLPRLRRRGAGLPVLFLSDLPRAETVAAFFEADLFLFASRIEAAPLVLLEAEAAGIPFVSTDVGNVRDLSGGVVTSPERLAAEASALLDDPERRRRLGASGRKEWQSSFGWERIVDGWESLYLRLHERKRETRARLRSVPPRTPAPPEPGRPIVGVVFSKDRPLQLDATLRSWDLHAAETDRFRMAVLYTASSSRMESDYRQVRRDHPGVWFVRERDFRGDLLALLRGHEKVLFLVDDCVFVRPFRLEELSRLLAADPEAIGLSLRLGENTTYCYAMDRPQAVPPSTRPAPGFLRHDWRDAEFDFGYPLEVSSSLYRLDLLLPLLEALPFRNPNTLESELAAAAARFRSSRPALLSAERSLAFCIPVNRVQDTCDNRAGVANAQPAAVLAERYRSGARVDVQALAGHVPGSVHEELPLPLLEGRAPRPVVSVVVPCHGQARYLEACVESVVAQTFPSWEIVVVDDGSPDDTVAVAERIIARHPDRDIRLLRQENGGLADARNAGVRASRGAYVLPLDADDLLEPGMLEACVGLLDAEPSVSIAYTDVRHFGAEEKVVRAAEFDRRRIRHGNQLNYCSMYRRTVWEDVGGYDDLMSLGYEDWDFWVRCAERGLVARRIPAPLLRYRVKPGSMYGTALAHDGPLRARLILDNERAYSRRARAAARRTLLANPLPAPVRAPLVSVVVPTRNRPHLLRETLRSILAQTVQDLEILVVNDAGIDVEDVVRLSGASAVTRTIRHEVRRGLAAARNSGLAFARGRYVAYLDDDDHYFPEHLETLLSVLTTSGIQVAYSDASRFEEAAGPGGRYTRVGEKVLYSSDFDPGKLLDGNYIPVPCIVHERSCLLETGGFDESLANHEDWDLWIRLSRRFLFVHVPAVTCEFRWRTDGTTMSSARNRRYTRTLGRLWGRYLPWRFLAPVLRESDPRPIRSPWGDVFLEGVPQAVRRIGNRLSRGHGPS